jgi:hypothetical protein
LIELEVLPKQALVEETAGSKLVSGGGVKDVEAMLKKIQAAKGGVIFVDESYQLCPDTDMEGRKVLDFILANSERLLGPYGPVVWIFAGYQNKMDKLFEHNPGLPSRFPLTLKFDDYSDEELMQIFKSLIRNIEIQPPPPPTPVEAPKKTTSINIPNNNRYALSRQGYDFYNKADEMDEWDNTWKWNSAMSTFEDSCNNITGYGASQLGTAINPLISRTDNSAWLYNRARKQWYKQADPSFVSEVYPGKPQPVKETSVTTAQPFTVTDEKWIRIAIRRLGKGRGKVGFGNARAVRILFDQVKGRQASRLAKLKMSGKKCNLFELDRYDLLGPKADMVAVQSSQAWKKLKAMEGLEEVKKEKLLELVILNAEREENEQPLLEVSLNRIFLGNPSTGKVCYMPLIFLWPFR